MSYITTITDKANELVSKSGLTSHPKIVALAALPASVIALVLPAACRDYQSYLAIGPGGTPYNAVGWLTVRLLVNPFMRESFGTRIYDRKVDAGDAVGFLGDLPYRQGERPTMGAFAVPQRQINQWPSQEIMDKLMVDYKAFLDRNQHVVDRVPSLMEKHTDAAHVCKHVHLTPVAKQMRREICHVHGTSDHSVHVTLSPADCKKVIESGWGQRFPLGGSTVLRNLTFGRVFVIPTEFVFLYAPRNEEEIAILMQIVKASVQYVTGMKDVR